MTLGHQGCSRSFSARDKNILSRFCNSLVASPLDWQPKMGALAQDRTRAAYVFKAAGKILTARRTERLMTEHLTRITRERDVDTFCGLKERNGPNSSGARLGLPIIGKLLGHTQSATTQRYAHLDNDPLKKASERIGSRLAAAMGEVKPRVRASPTCRRHDQRIDAGRVAGYFRPRAAPLRTP